MPRGGTVKSSYSPSIKPPHPEGGVVDEQPASWWDVMPQLVDDNSTDSWTDYQVLEQNGSPNPGNLRKLEFRVNTQASKYFLPSQAYFLVEMTLRSTHPYDPTDSASQAASLARNFTATDGTALAGIPLGGQLESCEYYIANHLVERVEQADVSTLMHYLLNFDYTRQNKEQLLATSTGDLANRAADATAVQPTNGNAVQPNFNERFIVDSVKRSFDDANDEKKYTYQLRVPLSALFPWARQNRMVFSGQQHRVVLNMKSSGDLTTFFTTHATTPGDLLVPEMKISHIEMRVPMLEASDYVKASLRKILSTQPKITYGWETAMAYQTIVQNNAINNISWRITDGSSNINTIVVLARAVNALTDYRYDPLASTMSVARAKLKFNGNQVPNENVHEVESDRDRLRLYDHLLRVQGCLETSDKDSPISFAQFKRAYQIIVFDMKNSTARDHKSFTALSTVDLHASFINDSGLNGSNLDLTAILFADRFMQMEYSRERESLMISGLEGDY